MKRFITVLFLLQTFINILPAQSEAGAIFLLMLISIHVLAVIYHHLFLKDPILKKIL